MDSTYSSDSKAGLLGPTSHMLLGVEVEAVLPLGDLGHIPLATPGPPDKTEEATDLMEAISAEVLLTKVTHKRSQRLTPRSQTMTATSGAGPVTNTAIVNRAIEPMNA